MNQRIEDLDTLLHHLSAAERIIKELPRYGRHLTAIQKIGDAARRSLSDANRKAYEEQSKEGQTDGHTR